MKRPLLLDLFCGAGGAAMGYYRAGFDVVGIDFKSQPRFPFPFIQADTTDPLPVNISAFDVIHASPPCQAYSVTAHLPQCKGKSYPDLMAVTRDKLQAIGKPYVIENVIGAPMKTQIILCGLQFGLKVFRHRCFESNKLLFQPGHVPHGDRRIGKDGFCCVAGHGDAGKNNKIDKYYRRKATWETAMGIDWMSKYELTQAIPPAYTEYIGKFLLETLQ